MSVDEPDYTEYSLPDLYDARRAIDVSRYPERAKRLELLIRDRLASARRGEAAVAPSTPTVVHPAASVKPGRMPSLGQGLGEIAASLLFGYLFYRQAQSSEDGISFKLIAVFIAVTGVIAGSYRLYNAFARRRFTDHDIVPAGAEPDPLSVALGHEKDDRREP